MDLAVASSTSTLTSIDSCITLKFRKEKKTSRTYIIGLEQFVPDVDKFCKDLKKTLGTGSNVIEEDGSKMYGFQGDFIERIYNYLISKGIDKSKIKK
uniref:SUI1 domain-containing protein n=1 Tax=viral metagenome TaxID=1070528 RepID=A0A6C0EB76_9ZZZZ